MTKFYAGLVLKISGLILVVLWLATLMLYPLRNSKKEVVAERFIKNNDIIEREVGEIKQIVTSNDDNSSRSSELARRLKSGESLTDQINLPQTNKIIGTKKTIEYKVEFEQQEYFNRGIHYFTVEKAFWREEAGEWQKISPTIFENYFLLFK